MVDLKDAACRRRRRRQLTTLMDIQARAVQNQEEDEDTSVEESSSEKVTNSVSSPNDSIESESIIGREVQETMAMGAALGMKFQPNSSEVLESMIHLEAQEYSKTLEREVGR